VTHDATTRPRITAGHRRLLLAAAALTWLLITLGGTVCVTESAQGCPDWPGCYGRLLPPPRIDAVIEYTHRLVAMLTGPVIVAAALVGWRRARALPWVSGPPVVAIAFLLAVVVFGAFAVLRGLPPWIAALDLGSALVVLALVLTAAVVAYVYRARPDLPAWPALRTPFARLALWTAVAVFLVLVSGVLVAEPGSLVRCLGWPLYTGPWQPAGARGAWALGRRLLALLTTGLLVAVVVQAWRTQRRHPALVRVATVLGALFLAETLVGALLAPTGDPAALLVLYVALAAALWALSVVLAVAAGLLSGTLTVP
jgi:cytochrome c oxidase assembly protein subunit 15